MACISRGEDHSPVELFRMSPALKMDVPMPPRCDNALQSKESGHEVQLTIYMLDHEVPIMKGMIIWEEEIQTECTYYFFGAQERSVISRQLKEANISTLVLGSLSGGAIDSTRDLNENPMYQCTWPQTQRTTTSRIFVKYVYVYPTLHGSFTADGVLWEFDIHLRNYKNGKRTLHLTDRLPDQCPLLVQDQTTGTVLTGSKNQTIVTIPHKELQFTIIPNSVHYNCHKSTRTLHISSLGFLIEFESDTLLGTDNTTVLELILNEKIKDPNSIVPQLDYDLHNLQKAINHNSLSLEQKVCNLRVIRWAALIKDHRLDDMATFITGDPFAQGMLINGHYCVKVRIFSHLESNYGTFTFKSNDYILYSSENGTVPVSPISGIINPSNLPNSLIPPVLPLANGSYLNILDRHILNPSRNLDLITVHLGSLRGFETIDIEHASWDSLTHVTSGSTEYGSIMTEYWNWIVHKLSWFGYLIIGLIITIVISCVFHLIRSLPRGKLSTMSRDQIPLTHVFS